MKGRWNIAKAVAVGLLIAGPALPAAADDVKLGLLIGFTGDMGPWAPALNNAAMLAVEEINADGGILGNKVVLISEDNASNVQGAIAGARKLVSVDGVSAIIGPESDPIVSLKDFAKDSKVPVVSTSAGTDALDQMGGTGRFIYRTSASDTFLGIAQAKVFLDELGVTELAVMAENSENTMSAANSFIKSYERFGGKVLKKVVVAPGQTTYLNELRDLASADPKFVFLAAGQTTGVAVVKQAYQRSYAWKWWVTTDLQNPDFVAAVGNDAAKGIESMVAGQLEADKSWQRFSELYEKKFGEKPEPGFYQAETYDAFIAVALAMESAKATDGAAVDANLIDVSTPEGEKVYSFAEGKKLLSEGKKIDYEGASGSIDFNEYGNVAVPAARLLEVDGEGNWVPVKVIDARSFPPS